MIGISKQEFLRRYTDALINDNASVFVGAGLSIPAGFADWRKLLKEIAEDLNLDIDQEYDLVAVAQYEVNRKGNRDRLNETIIQQFAREAKLTENHRLLARLPLDSVWTTNYDKLLETAFRDANKRPDVKTSAKQLLYYSAHSDLRIYKMHGDVDNPHDAVLTKDDYECYEVEHSAFTNQLLADLIQRRFLFLGFSFTDPNIEYTLNRLRRLLNPHRQSPAIAKEHFCLLRTPAQTDYEHLPEDEQQKQFELDTARFYHRVNDMLRMGISTVVVNSYSEITELLDSLHRRVSTQNVLVSGAAHNYGPLGFNRIEVLCESLGRLLIENGYNIVSGVGKGIGAAIMVGGHQALSNPSQSRFTNRLKLFPFPYWYADQTKRNAYYKLNRSEMAAQSGASIFICGNRICNADTGETEPSPGVLEEFQQAITNQHLIIPIGATGHAAKKIWDIVTMEQSRYYPRIDVSKELAILGNEASSDAHILESVLSILTKFRTSTL